MEHVATALDHVLAAHLAQLERLEPQRVVPQFDRHSPEVRDPCKPEHAVSHVVMPYFSSYRTIRAVLHGEARRHEAAVLGVHRGDAVEVAFFVELQITTVHSLRLLLEL